MPPKRLIKMCSTCGAFSPSKSHWSDGLVWGLEIIQRHVVLIYAWGPTPVTQGAGRAPVPKGVRHRDCYTPTLVWAVTIEMHRTPPYEVGGWGRPQLGRLVEKQRRFFSSCQVDKCAGDLLKTTLAGTPPAQYPYSPPLGPFPSFVFPYAMKQIGLGPWRILAHRVVWLGPTRGRLPSRKST